MQCSRAPRASLLAFALLAAASPATARQAPLNQSYSLSAGNLFALFGKPLYEGNLEGSYVYQSSAGSDEVEVKMSLTPLIVGTLKGRGEAKFLLMVHYDTVFPEGTDVTVKREGNRLNAPGVGDNTRGAALMLAIIRAMNAAKFQTTDDILFVGNVGEEGEGDLRGVKFLMQKGKYKDRITEFIAIDGGQQGSITRGGVGSRRYRVTFKGPGGHSYGAFGLVNPAYAMGSAIARFSQIKVPQQPKTTFNVGVVSGGTSVNSIPAEVQMVVDMRSVSCACSSRDAHSAHRFHHRHHTCGLTFLTGRGSCWQSIW